MRKVTDKNKLPKDYLTLDDMFLLTHPAILPLDFTHMGTLFVINKKLDGKFTLGDLNSFAGIIHL